MRNILSAFFLFILIDMAAQPGQNNYPVIRLTNSVECTMVKDQGQSPTCWVFGSNSLFESDLLKKNQSSIDISEMFIARYAYIDKANKYLATGGKTYFEGGGQFHDVIRVIKKYGMVPEAAYTGRQESNYGHNHKELDTAMKHYINTLLADGKKELDETTMQQVNEILDKHLGKVPASFIYKGKEYTPRSFADDVVQFRDEYVELMSFSNLPLYKKCLLVDKYNWAGDSLYNITLDDMRMIVDTALTKGWSVGWEGDVTDPAFNYMKGYASMPDSAYTFDGSRIQNYKTEKTERDHMLHLVGMGSDMSNNKWYYLKNSWGTWLSHFDGYMFMNKNYFNMQTVILMVNREGLPLPLKQKLGL